MLYESAVWLKSHSHKISDHSLFQNSKVPGPHAQCSYAEEFSHIILMLQKYLHVHEVTR